MSSTISHLNFTVPSPANTTGATLLDSESDESSSGGTPVIAGVSAGVVAVIIGLGLIILVWYIIRAKKKRNMEVSRRHRYAVSDEEDGATAEEVRPLGNADDNVTETTNSNSSPSHGTATD